MEKNTRLKEILSTIQGFLLASGALLKAACPHPSWLFQRNAACPRAVDMKLSITSCVWWCCHLVTAKAKIVRAERFPKLLSLIQHQSTGKTLLFVDWKKLVVDAKVNCRNSQVTAYQTSDICTVFEAKNSASVIMFRAVVADRSVIDPYFIERGLKISTKQCLDILKNCLLPSIK